MIWNAQQLALVMSSLGVAKQTDPRFLHTEIVVGNLNGCHNDFMQCSQDLSNAGLNGNHWRDLELEFGTALQDHYRGKVAFTADRYFTVLDSSDKRELNSALQEYVLQSLHGMTRSTYKPEKGAAGEDNIPLPANRLVIVPFMSATNEGRRLSNDAGKLGRIIKQKGYAGLYGAMTKGPSTAFLRGNKHIEGVTTGLLLKTESDGQLSAALSSWHIYPTIAATRWTSH